MVCGVLNRDVREIQWSRFDLETGQPTQVYNNQDGVIDSDNFAIEQSDGADGQEYFNLVVRIVITVSKNHTVLKFAHTGRQRLSR